MSKQSACVGAFWAAGPAADVPGLTQVCPSMLLRSLRCSSRCFFSLACSLRLVAEKLYCASGSFLLWVQLKVNQSTWTMRTAFLPIVSASLTGNRDTRWSAYRLAEDLLSRDRF